MNIILLGAPGSGKGTQADFITKKYGIPKISSGEILRSIINSGSNLGNKIKKIINIGKLVNDKLILNFIKDRILKKDCKNGFLLDGFPRTIFQAKAIKEIGINIDYVLEFKISDALVMNRIIGRRIHIPSGRIYHIKFNPPKIINKDDITGENLSIRQDDQEITIQKRLFEYHQRTIPLIFYYRQEAKINNIKYHKIDATCKINDINSMLSMIIN
ncbi:Adenylate kinase [Serratia symbiotica]|nr:Adenylate kinase [Serratia symbiotica]